MARRGGSGEWISLAGLRVDGRRPNEIRRMRCTLGAEHNADGSACLEQGQTKVLAVVHGPHDVSRRSDEAHDRAVIVCDVYDTPFSGLERKKRRQADRKSLEMALAIKQVFEAAVTMNLYPRTQIDIHVYILQSDGGALPVAINAASLALVDAGIAMKEMVCACSAALMDGTTPVLDVNNMEQGSMAPYMPVAAMPLHDEVVLMQSVSRLELTRFEELLRAGMKGCSLVSELMQQEVREHVKRLAAAQLALRQ